MRTFTILISVLLALFEVLYAQTTQTFTSSGSFVVPPGVTELTVECWGGGGRGGSLSSNGNGGGGGGGGAYARSVLTVIPGNTYTVTVGAGSNGTGAGGDSWFSTSTTILAKGGGSCANNSSTGANGGSAAASIGDVRFSGGNGYTSADSNGGGGGSSAGSAAAGNSASGTAGATAPAGGGNGGNGRTGSNGNGSTGSVPGGGGGGARRTGGTGTRTGGTGGGGQVNVTFDFDFPLASCVPAASYSALPDNSCGSNNGISVPIIISGLPASLGTGPGQAVLQRVEIITNHTYNRDHNIRLTSPGAQTRNILLNRFGNGDNLGVPGTCPASPLVLQDGGAALVNTNTSNPTGPYAPEESLSGFTGDPNGTWTLFVCDNEAADLGNLRYVNLVFGEYDCANVLNGPQLSGTACNDGDPTTVNDTWANDCQCQGQPNILYSLSGGDYADNIWSYTPGGPAAGVIPNQHSSIVIRNGHHITFTGTRQARSFTIESGGSFALGSGTLTVNGTALTNDGSFDGGTGTLILAGGSNVSVGGSEPMDIFNLTVTNTAGATVDATVDVRNALTLSAGTFTANVPVRLVSTASRTGRLAPVAAGASYVGNITVERYVPGGATNWRMFASPVSGATMANWNDDFYTAGFPGSNYPNFYSGGELWPTVRWYNEAHTGAGINDGLTGVSGNGHALTPGQGFAAWSGSNLGGTQAFVVDVTGPPTVAQSPFTLPMSHTNTGTPATDGWNLVGNPLPSPISFAAINRGANVQNAYWVFNPANGNNASYSNGLGTNSANGIIQSSQGFWLKASGPAVTTTLTESAKATQQSGGIFGGQENVNVPLVRMAISSGINSYRDEALVAFHEGSPALDEDDALKFVFAHPNAPQISTRSSDGHALAINRHGVYSGELAIPVLVDVAVTGTYTITASDMEHLNGLSCLVLEDLVTGTITPLHEGATYSFSIAANANAEVPRFMLRATAPIPFAFSDAACFGAGGSAQLDVPAGAYGITWSNSAGEVLFSDVTTVEELPAGNYQVSMSSTGSACGQLVQSFTITEPFAMEAYVEVGMPSCHDASDATLTLEVLGGVAPYTYLWSNGATTATLQNVGAGSYVVTVTDANGCTLQPGALVVNAPAPLGGEIVEPEATVVGQAVFFASTAPASSEHSWDFGDGNTSSDWAPVHSYDLPGTYVVTLTLRDGECQRSLQTTISVSVSTGLNELDADEVRAYSNGEALVLLSNLGQELHVQVYDAAGRMKTVKRVPAHSNRLEIPTSGWAPGVYFLNASTSWEQWTFTLPVVE